MDQFLKKSIRLTGKLKRNIFRWHAPYAADSKWLTLFQRNLIFFLYFGPFGRLGQNKRQLRRMPVLEIPDDHPPNNPVLVGSHF